MTSEFNKSDHAVAQAARAIIAEFDQHQIETGRVTPETYAVPGRPDLIEENGTMVRVKLLNNLKRALEALGQ